MVYINPEPSPVASCSNNLKNITFALHSYASDHGCFPPVYMADKYGKPKHSWRTLILPYIERKDLYDSYDFDEPWDGPNNRKLTGIHVDLFQCPATETTKKSLTNYMAVTGPGTVWPDDNGVRMEDITDGTSNTILLVELADSDIHCMEPRDISLDEALGKHLDNKARVPTSTHYTEATYLYKSMPIAGHIAMADGSIRRLYKRPPRQDIAAMLSINGGDTVKQPDPDCPRDEYTYSTTELLRWDHVIGLPLFLIAVVWFWYRLLKKPVNSSS